LKKYYLGRPNDAFNVMRTLGLGISKANLATIQKANKDDAAIVQQLTGKKTIDGKVRELLRDLTAGLISFEQVIAP
jgi:hypothetical protein